jgi:ABC-type phosphate transport system substrate-binding protein
VKTHQTLIRDFLLVFFFILFLPNVSYCQISIIVSSSSSHKLSEDEVKEIFTGSKTTWSNGSKIDIIDQSDSETGKKFYDNFLGKTVNQVRVQWTKLILSGQASAPIKASNDSEVKKTVSKNNNAIGYISSKELDNSVKELFKIK